MKVGHKNIHAYWKNVKATNGFRKFLVFLIFVAISALFWFILALNDNIQEDLEVKLNVVNVPDSVTFISDPPEYLHVMIKDKGTNFLRNSIFSRPTVDLNFKEFARDGVFYVNRGELTSGLKKVFGQSATIITTSKDSLRLVYTTGPGKRVPVEVVMKDITAAVGKIISGKPQINPGGVVVYGERDQLDTINKVVTEKLRCQNLEESKTFTVKLRKIRGVKIKPDEVKVTINVEQLVRKQVKAVIRIDNVPRGEDLLLFPSTANVEYYLPMSKFGSMEDEVEVFVNYNDLNSSSNRLPLHLGRYNPEFTNVRLLDQSVEYATVKN